MAFKIEDILTKIESAEQDVKTAMEGLDPTSVNVVDFLKVQAKVNKLSQICEVNSSLMSAIHQASCSCARNTK